MARGVAGEGLPYIEQMFIKFFLIPSVRVLFTWRISLILLKREVSIIKKLVDNLPKDKLQQQVLIQRAFAIEDHSRDYSVNMTLEHLTIAGNAVMLVIKTLTKEEPFDKPIKIEAVKPTQNTEEEHKKFFEFMQNYTKYIEKHPRNQSKMTKKHPWFVEFNNCDWASFMFMHTFIHRRQIEAIIKEIK